MSDITLNTYNSIAKDYAAKDTGLIKPELKFFIENLKGTKVLDAGCGFGRDLEFLIKSGLESYGFDGSKELLKLANVRSPKSKLELADLREKLPYSNFFFDGIWARNVLHHLKSAEVENALAELKRILKPNGIIYIEWKEGKEEGFVKEEVSFGKARYYNLLSKKEVEQLIKKSGLIIMKSGSYNWNERFHGKRKYSNFITIFASKI
jgi:SAM-dependent methyltransferase